MFEDIIQFCFKLIYIMFQSIFALFMKTCLQKDKGGGIFTKFLNLYSCKIDQIVLVVENT